MAIFAVAAIAVYAAGGGRQPVAKRALRQTFSVRGGVNAAFHPGLKQALNIQIRNNRRRPVWIIRLQYAIAIDAEHAARGCSVTRDFTLRQIPITAFPLRVPPSRKRAGYRTLRRLGVKKGAWLKMNNLRRTNQDGCKGASIRIVYQGDSMLRKPSMAGVDQLDELQTGRPQ